MTGIEIRDSSEGIWDDGEWISWAWINEQIEIQENGPPRENGIEEEFEDEDRQPSYELFLRILSAKRYYEHTNGEISPDWGSIGETYVAERFGVKLCSQNTEGHDGRLRNSLIEVKTISPHKNRPFVTAKRSGNFHVLAVVRVTRDDIIDARFIQRSSLPEGNGGQRFVISWETACRLGTEAPPNIKSRTD